LGLPRKVSPAEAVEESHKKIVSEREEVCVGVCVSEKGRKHMCKGLLQSGREHVCVCFRESESEKACLSVCVCVCVKIREKKNMCVYVSVYV